MCSKWDFTVTEYTPEFLVKIRFSGFNDPGKTYGPPENCYPPESEDEREVVALELFGKVFEGAELDAFFKENPGVWRLASEWADKRDFPEQEPDYDDDPPKDEGDRMEYEDCRPD